jgi:hypothetical protein
LFFLVTHQHDWLSFLVIPVFGVRLTFLPESALPKLSKKHTISVYSHEVRRSLLVDALAENPQSATLEKL